jgi:hypothetical protein
MARHWTAEELLTVSRGFQPACVLMAAAGFVAPTLVLRDPHMNSVVQAVKP